MIESGDCVFASFEEYKDKIPELCHTMQQYYVTWISPNYYMSLAAVIYRYFPPFSCNGKWEISVGLSS